MITPHPPHTPHHSASNALLCKISLQTKTKHRSTRGLRVVHGRAFISARLHAGAHKSARTSDRFGSRLTFSLGRGALAPRRRRPAQDSVPSPQCSASLVRARMPGTPRTLCVVRRVQVGERRDHERRDQPGLLRGTRAPDHAALPGWGRGSTFSPAQRRPRPSQRGHRPRKGRPWTAWTDHQL